MTTVTNHEVVLWFQGRFADFRQRGLVTQTQSDAYNRAHPDRQHVGPVREISSWQRAERMARPTLTTAQKAAREGGAS